MSDVGTDAKPKAPRQTNVFDVLETLVEGAVIAMFIVIVFSFLGDAWIFAGEKLSDDTVQTVVESCDGDEKCVERMIEVIDGD